MLQIRFNQGRYLNALDLKTPIATIEKITLCGSLGEQNAGSFLIDRFDLWIANLHQPTRQLTHVAMLKLLIFTGIRNAELVRLRLTDVDLQNCQLRIEQGKGHKDRYVLFPSSFRGELAQYVARQRSARATYLFESNRCRPYSTRRLRQIVKQYAVAAGIEKRVYPHLFRHQFITYLTKQGIISPKLQLLSGHTTEQSLGVYRGLALSDVVEQWR
jgi:integrase/recombinase XerD